MALTDHVPDLAAAEVFKAVPLQRIAAILATRRTG